MVFVALGEHDGMTVLQILKIVISLSSGMIKHIKFLDDGILLNGKRVTVRAVLRDSSVTKEILLRDNTRYKRYFNPELNPEIDPDNKFPSK